MSSPEINIVTVINIITAAISLTSSPALKKALSDALTIAQAPTAQASMPQAPTAQASTAQASTAQAPTAQASMPQVSTAKAPVNSEERWSDQEDEKMFFHLPPTPCTSRPGDIATTIKNDISNIPGFLQNVSTAVKGMRKDISIKGEKVGLIRTNQENIFIVAYNYGNGTYTTNINSDVKYKYCCPKLYLNEVTNAVNFEIEGTHDLIVVHVKDVKDVKDAKDAKDAKDVKKFDFVIQICVFKRT